MKMPALPPIASFCPLWSLLSSSWYSLLLLQQSPFGDTYHRSMESFLLIISIYLSSSTCGATLLWVLVHSDLPLFWFYIFCCFYCITVYFQFYHILVIFTVGLCLSGVYLSDQYLWWCRQLCSASLTLSPVHLTDHHFLPLQPWFSLGGHFNYSTLGGHNALS